MTYTVTLSRFNVEGLTYIFTKCLFLWLLEATIQKGVFWFFRGEWQSFLDLMAFCGYKFVVMCPIAAADLVVDRLTSYMVMFGFCVSYGLFFYRTLTHYDKKNIVEAHMAEVSLSRRTMLLGNSVV